MDKPDQVSAGAIMSSSAVEINVVIQIQFKGDATKRIISIVSVILPLEDPGRPRLPP